MASIKLGSVGKNAGFNFDKFDSLDFFDYDNSSKPVSTGFKIFADSKNSTEVKGSGLTYTIDDGEIVALKSGKIDALVQITKGVTIFSATGLKLDAKALSNTLDDSNSARGLALLLSGNDKVTGTAFADIVHGGAGKDTLYGAAGDDALYGGSGADGLHGGAGKDLFIFRATSDSTVAATGRDTILDFSVKDGDRIDLAKIDANTRIDGNQAFSFIDGKAFTGKAGELRAETKASETIVYGDVNGDGKADFSVYLDDAVMMSKGYFLL